MPKGFKTANNRTTEFSKVFRSADENKLSQLSSQESVPGELDELNKEKIRLELKSKKQDIDERKLYADRIFKLVSIWLIGLGVVVFLQGSKYFNLSTIVLSTLVGSTTLGIFGSLRAIVKYLFSQERNS